MHSQGMNPPEALRAGRRALDGIREFILLDDWTWEPETRSWWLHGRITLEIEANDFVPPASDWYIKVSPAYPWGVIAFYPASTGGLQHTFPHQNYNGDDPGVCRWRQGRLCADTGGRVLGRHGYDIEPFDVHERLAWHVQRVMEWLQAASLGDLARGGDPFELPDFRRTSQVTLAFNETRENLDTWNVVAESVGLADLALMPGATETSYIRAFKTLKGVPVVEMQWGKFLAETTEPMPVALWIRFPSTPVLEPWQAPMTWGEMRTALQEQAADLNQLLRQGATKIRDGESHILLLGFPIPEVFSGPLVRMHWLATKLPTLTINNPRGFRPTNDLGRWQQDRDVLLSDATSIEWISTENWSTEEFSGRGRLAPTFIDRKVALIGAGALGSVIGELLVRAGVNVVTVCDGDSLHAGNLVRHTLSLESVGGNKAKEVARKLNASSPHVTVSAVRSGLSYGQEASALGITSADLVIDCTGSDEALKWLAQIEFSGRTMFASISLGMFANRLFVFCASGSSFPIDRFFEAVGPWITREMSESYETELPREGIGCWHPLFPARIDDIWMMASAAVKVIEAKLELVTEEPTLSVIEQVYDDGRFTGLRTVYAA